MMKTYTVLTSPLTRANVDKDGWVCGVICLHLSDLIDNDLEGVLDLMSERLTGTPLLSDISYSVRGHEGNALHVEVKGDASLCWENES